MHFGGCQGGCKKLSIEHQPCLVLQKGRLRVEGLADHRGNDKDRKIPKSDGAIATKQPSQIQYESKSYIGPNATGILVNSMGSNMLQFGLRFTKTTLASNGCRRMDGIREYGCLQLGGWFGIQRISTP